MIISSKDELDDCLAQGAYSSVGCYPLYFAVGHGETWHPKCVKAAMADGDAPKVWGHDANWEDPELYCEYCGERIESAYAEPEES